MIPPRGFEDEKYPLIHRVIHSTGLSLSADTLNTVFFPIVMHSKDVDVATTAIQTNPHNSEYVEETGTLCQGMSIIDKMRISLKFSMTHYCEPDHWASGNSDTAPVWVGDSVPALKFSWRPIFNVFPEKLDAADDDTTATVASILAMTKDATNEDVVAITTNKLPVLGPGETAHPVSNVNAVQVFGDFNMTTNTNYEDHVFDEDLLQTALRRYTNKGALRSCLGRTRHVTLTRRHPVAKFYIDKPVPRAIRRIMPYSLFGVMWISLYCCSCYIYIF